MGGIVHTAGPAALLVTALLSAGCQATPAARALSLPPAPLADRAQQTRRFDGVAEAELLSACAGVLQDLGFNIDASEAELGLLVASKARPAGSRAQSTFAVLAEVFMDVEIAVDREQRIRASLVTTPTAAAADSYLVRITFQRVVWNTDNDVSKREALRDPELYRQFFERLSKSVFLEANSP